MEHWEIKNRSYWLSEDTKLPVRVEVIEEAYWCGAIPVGMTGKVTSRSNAGFSGIQAWVELDAGGAVMISAGNLRPTSG